MVMAAAKTAIAAAAYLSFLFKACPRVEDTFARQHFCSICDGEQRKPKRMAPQLVRGLSTWNSPVTLPKKRGANGHEAAQDRGHHHRRGDRAGGAVATAAGFLSGL